tara:strand:- start:2552 stop:2776 length:225 start_codon:yes stop_codon:yes gene_type:complete
MVAENPAAIVKHLRAFADELEQGKSDSNCITTDPDGTVTDHDFMHCNDVWCRCEGDHNIKSCKTISGEELRSLQ